MMNKPTGYLTTVSDPDNRPTVMALLPDLDDFMKPVGRLDVNTEGMLLFTNDGEMAYRLTHPKYHVPKRYTAAIEGKVTKQGLTPLIRGIKLYDGTFKFSELTVLKPGKNQTMVEAVIHEGKKRLVRRMFAKVGYPVKFLLRNGIGPLQLGHLPKGACRPLRKGELMALRKAVQLEDKDEY
jgi:pseudouridine synthase